METDKLRERIATQLEVMADDIRTTDFDWLIKDSAAALFDLSRGGGLMDKLATELANAAYYDCPLCGSDFHTERERGGRECRDYQSEGK